MSWTAEDEQIAERSAQTLRRLQARNGPDVLRELQIIRNQVANKRGDEHERAEAWLACSALVKAMEQNPGAGNIAGLWHRAIQATEAWRGSMRQN